MRLTDGELVEKVQAGDASPFDELVSRYRSRIYYLALSKVNCEESARDLAQDAFVRAYVSISSIREPDKFASWIAGIACNVCNTHLRKPREVLLAPGIAEELGAGCGSTDEPDADAQAAREILYGLPNGTRSAAILYFVEEMKMTEIAEFLGTTLGAVKARIHMARSRIKKEMVDMVRQTAKRKEPGDEFDRSLKRRLELARWYRELGELFAIGVNVSTALERLRHGDYSEPVKDATASLLAAVSSGSSISDALEELPALVSPETIPMMRAGETGGALDWSAGMLADWIEVESARRNIDLIFWCRVLERMLWNRVPLVEALRRALDISRNKSLSQATKEMIERVERNEQISPVTEKYTDVFPPKLRVAMIMGEPEGFLDLAVALGWAGAQMAADVCRLLLGDKVELPSYEPDHIVRWFRGNADSLVRLLAHGDPAIRATAVELAGRFKVESVAQEVTRLLDDPDTTVVKAAIRALVNLGSVPPADVFTERLKAKDACVRLTAVKALVDLEQVHEAAGSLAQLLADPDERVFDAAVSTLESAKELDALGSRAVDLVRSGRNAETRTWAARILSKHHDFPTPEDVLIDMLNDDLIEVRCAAAMILASRSDWRALPVLREGIAAREVPQDYLFVAADMEKG